MNTTPNLKPHTVAMTHTVLRKLETLAEGEPLKLSPDEVIFLARRLKNSAKSPISAKLWARRALKCARRGWNITLEQLLDAAPPIDGHKLELDYGEVYRHV